jgi:ElaB/YqjD/DUF883 family membrane-anchored ribosome-binding protein
METTLRVNTSNAAGMPNFGDSALNKASSSAHAAVNSIAGAAKPAIERVAGMAHEAVDSAAGAAAPAARWLGEQGGSLNATQKKLLADTSSFVSAHPLKSVGIAALAGFLVSRMLR